MTTDETRPLDDLQSALQTYVNTQADSPALVDNAMVIWEQVGYDEDGVTQRGIMYAVPTDNFTLSGSLGLLEAARVFVRRDILGETP